MSWNDPVYIYLIYIHKNTYIYMYIFTGMLETSEGWPLPPTVPAPRRISLWMADELAGGFPC